VTDIMGEISAATSEQAAGVAEVSQAVTEMDQATQQNAALVEQMAAAASSLKSQAEELVQTVAVFGASEGAHQATRQFRSAPVKNATPRMAPAAKPLNLSSSRPAPKAAPKPSVPKVGMSAKPAVPSPAPSSPPKTQPKPAPAGGDEEWETF